ncbi:MAG: DNA gyrase subunit A, partial [Anaerolineae bacterium]
MELGIIRQINIDAEMQASYLDYAMSVIVARALPDVRDGLKPVHRRILYAMHDLGLQPDKPYKKSARIVGEVLGKYHPHGDAAVYEAMVRMAQNFSLRYPLVDGQGNFGSIDGDNAAAMRYTEARLAQIATEMLADIEKDTVDWTDNFDGTLKEPSVLPAALPNLLVNGASGIAVGMSTNIPPHNLGEVCDALCYLIDNYDRHDDVTVEDLMRFIPGPDFPTGGVIYRYARAGGGPEEREDVIAKAYAGGRGSIVVQAKAHIEEMSRNRSRIVVTELPYQTNKTNLIERIAELARDGRIEGITDLRDESDRTGMRICIEMTRTVEPRQVLADLFKLTPLQQTFGVSLLALVDGEPRLLSLKRMLLHFLEHRQAVIVRRSRHELEKAKQRAHILEGLLRALDVLDEVIALIRASRTADSAKQGLIEKFKFTEIQAQAILDMQLRRLAALERRKLQDEYREVVARIKELEALLKSPKKVLALIKHDLLTLKEKYGDPRRTQVAERVQGTLTSHDLLPDEEVWVVLSADGSLSRRRAAGPISGEAGAGLVKGASVFSTLPAPMLLARANTRDDLYLCSARGQVARIGAHQVPESGSHFAELSGLSRRDRLVALLPLPKPGAAELNGYLLLATAQGKIKRVALADLADQAGANPAVIGLDEGDELAWAGLSAGGSNWMLVTAQGQAIRFAEEEVRAMGLPAGGIGGIKLAAKDRVVACAALAPSTDHQSTNPPTHLAIVTALGFVKRTPLADFPTQGRNGQGVVAARLTPKSGQIAAVALLGTGDALLCGLSSGKSRLLAVADVPEMGRATSGRQVIAPAAGETIVGAFAVPEVEAEVKVEAEAKLSAVGSVDKAEPAKPTRGRKTAAGPEATPPETAKPAAKAADKAAPAPVEPAKPTRGRKTAPAPEATPVEPAKAARKRQAAAEPAAPAPAAPAGKPAAKAADKAAPAPVEPAKPTRGRKTAPAPEAT